jgi:tRNA G46 methylase TrmB
VEKARENNQEVGIGQIISQMSTPWPKHDKIKARLISNTPSKSMLEKV